MQSGFADRTEPLFVDRDEPMHELRSLVGGLLAGRGSGLLVEGLSGMGKTSLLGEFGKRIAAEDAARQCRVVTAHCHPGIGPGTAYGPIIDLLLALKPRQKRRLLKNFFGQAGRTTVDILPELLSTLVPGLGSVLKIGREATRAALGSGSMPFDSLLPFQQAVAARIVDEFLNLAAAGPPVLLVIDDVQYIDPSSLLVLDRLLRAVSGSPIAVVLSNALEERRDGSAESVDQLLRSWQYDGLLRRRALDGLPDDAVAELVRHLQPEAPSTLSASLSRFTDGHPIFVQLCLEEWRPEHGDRVALPQSLKQVVEDRLGRLPTGDQQLLITGATQGSTFLSATVAAALDAPHDEIMERLRTLAGPHRLITEAEKPDWAWYEATDCYRFQHKALRDVLYGKQTGQQRRSRHERIARALAAGADPAVYPLERRLAIARHFELAGPACLADSAATHHALARSAAIEGLSFAEAEQHCEKAIAAARALAVRDPSGDRQLAEAIELLLSLTEVRWRGDTESRGGSRIDELAAEAEQAAHRCAAPELIARTTLLRGKTLMATQGLVPGLDKLREAVEIAQQQDDAVALFVAKVEYGRQASKRDLAHGLEQLQQAEELYAAEPRLGGNTNPVLQHARNLNEMQLGISFFDSGKLGAALQRLVRCTERLRAEPLNAELPIALNYLAQVRTGLGLFDEAEQALREALRVEEERGGDSGWHAYNTALLAQLIARDPRRRGECLTLIEDAWLETERTWLINLVPIVRNLYAQVLLDTADGNGRTLETAHRLAGDTVAETRKTGMVRSEIAGLCLSAQIRLRQGDKAAAADDARASVALLDRTGDMPALRSEEVLFHAARALHASGARQEAAELLHRAQTKIEAKAGSIDDPGLRLSFLEDVPLNRAAALGELEGE